MSCQESIIHYIFKVSFKVGEEWIVPNDLSIEDPAIGNSIMVHFAIDGTITLSDPLKVLPLVFFPVKDVEAIRLDVMETNGDLIINEIIPNF